MKAGLDIRDETMATDSRVTIHMVASLDGFIARKNGMVELRYEVRR